ncbi:Sodium/hydrogen exchanger family-domain-containing protein [Gymnopilus junonius]|uniref:Sodium/hydrogen exchanger family-domain-containing protein n=1 Tax=Gymnopilus junonius TaxID=109634 RepID=A0A9P5N756_GYMJU|nr:Sodium/hydrogen exchanger family-domain-containing protein [Gymnopilus junonius]
MGEFSSHIIALFSRAAPEQGGVISGLNPSVYNPNDPFVLWVIQLIVIIAMINLLVLIFKPLRQPRVISEVIAGIVLGPTAMGRIPGFTNAIFPTASQPSLALTSTIGLVLFLFLVGLEIDTRLLRRNIVSSASVSVAGLVVPLGLGAALGVGVYREFVSPTVNFGNFLLFVAVAVGITAFPVLCRILTELKLLDTEVGMITLSAGIGNDVVGWVLLALTVALVNASSGLTALWVLLAGVGYTIFLLYPGRWAIRWLAKRTGSLEQGSPTVFMMTIILFTVFISAFYTDIIGIHPIFGGFLAGVIIPHDNGFAISIVEKLEDLVTITLLPLYFVGSGLKTNLGLLNTGIIWGYVVLICLVAFSSKFLACGIAARLNGYGWRESGAIGALMSCKGLVELIVLNIGLQANILTTQTFSMFVVHALILTFITTPLVLLFYPAKYRVHQKTEQNEGDVPSSLNPPSVDGRKTRFAIVLDKMEALPPAMTFTQLLQSTAFFPRSSFLSSVDEKRALAAGEELDLEPTSPSVTVEALRLMELTNRTSAVLRSQEADAIIHNDPVVSVYSTFGQLNNMKVSTNLSVVNVDEFPETIANHVSETKSQMVIIPWPRGHVSVSSGDDAHDHGLVATTRNPFDGVFHRTVTQDQTSSFVYSEFIRKVFASSPVDTALFVDRGVLHPSTPADNQHLFLAFFGGPDDRLALTFLVQLCERPSVTATVVRVSKTDGLVSSPLTAAPITHNTVAAIDTVYGQHDTQTRLASDTADNILWDAYTRSTASHSTSVASALSRISFLTESTSTPLRRVTEMVKTETATRRAGSKTLIVLAGRSRRMAVESFGGELRTLTSDGNSISTSVQRTLGDVGAALVATGVQASLLILQASPAVNA